MNVFRPSPKPDSVREKFALARRELSAALIEREEEVDLALTALLAGEHLLLVGPPGCGKSLLLDSVLSWTGGTRFTVLPTKYTTVEELMGPVSLAGLKEDRYVRVATGKLPEADFGFIDEVFKGSSAILNVMLKILNERTFDAGDGVVAQGATRAVPGGLERVARAQHRQGVVGPVRPVHPAKDGDGRPLARRPRAAPVGRGPRAEALGAPGPGRTRPGPAGGRDPVVVRRREGRAGGDPDGTRAGGRGAR